MSVTNPRENAIIQFRSQLVSMTPEFANALPSHIKPEKFQRVVMTVVQLQPDLLNCDRRSLFAACIKCAADGLVPDGREAALVKFGGQVQYMPMFTGIQKRVRNSGEIASIQAHVIYEHDEFTWSQGIEAGVAHLPKFPGDRGKPIGAYAIAKFKDGSDPQIEVMDVAAIERVRKVSKSSGSGPWVQWWEEMARKTVFRRLSKWLPLDAETDAIMRRDDEVGTPTVESAAGPVLDGEVQTSEGQTPDSFEQAASGVVAGDASKPGAKGTRLDAESYDWGSAELSPGDALIAEFAELKTLNDIQANEANAAVKSSIAKLPKPEQDRVRAAIEDMKNTMRAAA